MKISHAISTSNNNGIEQRKIPRVVCWMRVPYVHQRDGWFVLKHTHATHSLNATLSQSLACTPHRLTHGSDCLFFHRETVKPQEERLTELCWLQTGGII